MFKALESRLKEMGLQIDPVKATNRQQMIDNLKAGIEDNKTYLALTPTTAQNTAQIKKLTRQNNRLIRLVTNLLEVAE